MAHSPNRDSRGNPFDPAENQRMLDEIKARSAPQSAAQQYAATAPARQRSIDRANAAAYDVSSFPDVRQELWAATRRYMQAGDAEKNVNTMMMNQRARLGNKPDYQPWITSPERRRGIIAAQQQNAMNPVGAGFGVSNPAPVVDTANNPVQAGGATSNIEDNRLPEDIPGTQEYFMKYEFGGA